VAPLYHLSSFHLGLNLLSFIIKAINLEKKFVSLFSTVSNCFSFLLFYRFGFLRFIGIVILSVLGTSITYILLGRWVKTASKCTCLKSCSQAGAGGDRLLLPPLTLHCRPLRASLCPQGPASDFKTENNVLPCNHSENQVVTLATSHPLSLSSLYEVV
jgi:hypothetical protein